MQEKPKKATACWVVWVVTGIFLVATKLFSSSFLSKQGSSLCRDRGPPCVVTVFCSLS